MHLILVHRHSDYSAPASIDLHRFAVANNPVANIVLSTMAKNYLPTDGRNTVIAVPEDWVAENVEDNHEIITYSHSFSVPLCESKQNDWLTVTNGRFITSVSGLVPMRLFNCCDSDVITIDVSSALSGYREKERVTTSSFLAGVCRIYGDSILPQEIPKEWPHHVFVKDDAVKEIFAGDVFPLSFDQFADRCQDLKLRWRSFIIGGHVIDLATGAGLLKLVQSSRITPSILNGFNGSLKRTDGISENTRIFGKVFCGNDVVIGDNATIIGPTIICDGAKIGSASIIKNTVIGPRISIDDGLLVHDCVITSPQKNGSKYLVDAASMRSSVPEVAAEDGFRYWPMFSYARLGKRILDVMVSSVVLMFFAPVFALVALAIKLTNPGPVFFKHKRQGLRGMEFSCLKFRTMIAGADRIQEKLRRINQVDGPQFMMDDDPRVTVVGKFLRETFIDELPQFINIFLGQMSIIGPRPSPKTENLFCPSWRYARLSVKPGITGLWQVCRTRLAGRDFQEWIYYDTEYVKNISLSLDSKIFFKTAKKFVNSFLEHF
jgi:lipopolysaccharide/colanic/teichoic acid biosynthesis glycosyltransferase